MSSTAAQPRSRFRARAKHIQPRQNRNDSFEQYRDLISAFYLDELRPLKWIVEHMKQVYGFDGSTKQYRLRLKNWGLRQMFTRRDAAFVLRLLNQARNKGRDEVVMFSRHLKGRDDIAEYIAKTDSLGSEDQLLSYISDANKTPCYIRLPLLDLESGSLTWSQLPPGSVSETVRAPASSPAMVPLQDTLDSAQLFAPRSGLDGLEPDMKRHSAPLALQTPFATVSPMVAPIPGVGPSLSSPFHLHGFHEPANDLITPENNSYNHVGMNLRQPSEVGSNTILPPASSPSSSPRLDCPRAPNPARECPPDSAMSSILRYALLPAILLSEHFRGTSPGLWMTAQLQLQECKTQPDADILSRCIDLFAWIQVSNRVATLATVLLLRALLHVPGKLRTQVGVIVLRRWQVSQADFETSTRGYGQRIAERGLKKRHATSLTRTA